MINNAASVGIMLSAGATGASVAAAPHSPIAWIAPVFCGCFAALIVRGIAISTPTRRKKVWIFEVLVTALSVLLTGVVVADQSFGIMHSTLAGIGIGGLGVGVISIARTTAVSLLTGLAKSWLSASNADGDKP